MDRAVIDFLHSFLFLAICDGLARQHAWTQEPTLHDRWTAFGYACWRGTRPKWVWDKEKTEDVRAVWVRRAV